MDQSTLRTPARLALGAALLLATGSAFAHPGGWGDWDDRDGDDRRPIARVLDVAPHYVAVRVDVPEQRCWNERVGYDGGGYGYGYGYGDDGRHRRAGGAILGGLIGGVIGHNLGDEDSRGLTTAAGALVGGLIGHEVAASGDDDRRYGGGERYERGRGDGRYERDDRDERDRRYEQDAPRYAQRCQVVSRPQVERRLDGYDVVYQYEGRRYRTRLPYDPGPTLDLDRVGAPDWR
jgi:uncharacterized protein YcfJ